MAKFKQKKNTIKYWIMKYQIDNYLNDLGISKYKKNNLNVILTETVLLVGKICAVIKTVTA